MKLGLWCNRVSGLAGWGLLAVVSGFLAACSPPASNAVTMPDGASAAGVNLELARRELILADELFLEASETAGIAEAYRRFLAPSAIQLLSGYPPIEGRDNIYANFSDFADDSTAVSLRWDVEDAVVSASGDLGYTWGTYFYVGPDDQGIEALIEGNYVNIWRKSATGEWEVVLDIENRRGFAGSE